MKLLAFLFTLVPSIVSAAMAEPRLIERSKLIWSEGSPAFGGLSGVQIHGGGSKLLAIGDRGIWLTADLTRDAEGDITGVEMTRLGKLRDVDGTRMPSARANAEGLNLDSEGRAYVSFEGDIRVWRYDQIDGVPTPLPRYSEFATLSGNLSLESVAVGPDGNVYALPERTQRVRPSVPVYRLRDGVWDKDLEIRRGEGFMEVDADFGPDGRFYVLERKFKWLAGFATRLRSFSFGPEGFGDEQTLLSTNFGEMDNMEGLSVWRDPEGRTRVTMISDDNFFPLQRTYLIEYIVEP